MSNKTKQLPPIRVTENQYNTVLEMAENQDKKLSQYIRDQILNNNSNVPGVNDPYLLLTKLRLKYQEERKNTKNAFESVKINEKINTLDQIIIDLSTLLT